MKVLVLSALVGCASSSSTAPPPNTGPSAASLASGRLQVPPEKLTRVDATAAPILPDDMTRDRMAKANVVRVSGLFLVCIDAQGKVEAVDVVASTSLPDFDAKIQTHLRQWAYAPFSDDTGAKPVCTQVVVEYAQDPKNAPRVERR